LPGISPEAGEEALEEELEKFRKNGAGEQELGKVINKAESSLIFSEISLQNRAFNLALASLMGNTSMINEEAEKYRKVKKEQLTDIMLNKVVDSNASVVYYNADL
jgi:zinc protease